MKFSDAQWLITGGCGFIGTALVRGIRQLHGDARIRILDNLSVGARDDLSRVCVFSEWDAKDMQGQESLDGVSLVIGDIRDPKTCDACAKGMDIIVHLAANTGVAPSVDDPRSDMITNVVGTFNMLQAAHDHDVSRFVFASSGAPVGEVTPPIHEDLPTRPVSPYGASKMAGEGYCSAFFRTFNVNTAALRFGNVYGPGATHKSSVVAKFIKQALAGETCVVYGDGSQTRDFVFIDDLIRAILRIGAFPSLDDYEEQTNRKPPWGEVFQIATNREHTVNEIAKLLKEELKKNGVDMRVTYDRPRLGDVMRNYSDTSKAKDMLGWQAQVAIEEGIRQTVEWFLEQKK